MAASKTQQKKMKNELGEILIEKGIISPETLLEALQTMSKQDVKSRRLLHQILIDDFKADRDKIYSEVAEYYAFPTIDLSTLTIHENDLAFIRNELKRLTPQLRVYVEVYRALPFRVDSEYKDTVLVITPDPTSREINNIAKNFSFPKSKVCYVKLDQWEELWKSVNVDKSAYGSMFDNEAQKVFDIVEEAELDEHAIEEEINRSGLIELIQNIFFDAVRLGASDIHVIPKGIRTTEFHFRIDGKLTRWYTQEETRAESVVAVVKDRAQNLDRFERNKAQDGFAQFIIDNKIVRFRVSVIPVVGKDLKSKFESVVIRVLQEPKFSVRLEELGFDSFSFQSFMKAITKSYGIIIVTGPTGSGKSTTLYAALQAIMDSSLNILTVEDPVEFYIEGARQIKLNPKLDFEGALRSILRHDPDIVMVGEIRDRQTAEIAVKLANTGHLTFTTLHTNDAPSAIARLYKMGIEPFLLAYSVNMILAQRLVRKLCERCKRLVEEPDRDVLLRLGFDEQEIMNSTFYHAVGCINCIKGYFGRTAIYESLYFTKAIRRMILSAGSTIEEEAIRAEALRDGMQTLRAGAIQLLKKGLTTIEEVAAVTVEEE